MPEHGRKVRKNNRERLRRQEVRTALRTMFMAVARSPCGAARVPLQCAPRAHGLASDAAASMVVV